MQFRAQALPINAVGLGLEFDRKPLQRFIELADGLLFIDAFVTLQAFDRGSCRLGNCIRQLRFSATSWTF